VQNVFLIETLFYDSNRVWVAVLDEREKTESGVDYCEDSTGIIKPEVRNRLLDQQGAVEILFLITAYTYFS